MDGHTMPKPLKKGLKAGAPDDDPLLWDVFFLDAAGWEGRKILDDCQYEHVVDAIRSLAREPDPRHPKCEDVEPIDGFYELKLKYGPLGRLNLRVFFQVVDDSKAILIVHAWKKTVQSQTPPHVKRVVSNRLRWFDEGKYGRFN
jgi:hypothetical protein